VCAACNQRAGREIDQPLLKDWLLRQIRHAAGVSDRRGSPPPAPIERHALPDGTPVRVDPTTGAVNLVPFSRRTGNELTLSAGSESALEDLERKMRERYARRGTPSHPCPRFSANQSSASRSPSS
jgi:hypothetical protein